MGPLGKIRETIEESLGIVELKPITENLQKLSMDQLLAEASFFQYKALVRITYSDNPEQRLGVERLSELLRAVPGGTRVSPIENFKDEHQAIFNVRVISQKPARQCFMNFKRTCLERYRGIITNVEIGAGSIETKNYVK